MEIALTGIDGSGKTTFLKKTIPYLQTKGIAAGHIDLPYFTEVPGFENISGNFICPLWRWGEEHKNKPVLVFLMVLAVFLYFPARVKLRGRDMIIVEHQPRIDVETYCRIYLGKAGFFLAKIFKHLFPKPDMVTMLVISPEEAYKRLIGRGKTLQPHENLETLKRIDGLLRLSLKESGVNACFVEDPEPETFFNSCLLKEDEV